MKDQTRKIIFTVTLCIMIPVMLVSLFAISPYEVWDSAVVDYDALDVLKVIWLMLFCFNTAATLFAVPYRKSFFVIFIILAVTSLLRLMWLFSIG